MSILVHPPHGSMAELLRWLEESLLALRPAGGHPMRAEEQLTDTQYVVRAELPSVGRFLYVTTRGPVAVPVNYRMLGDAVVFRTGQGGGIAEAIGERGAVGCLTPREITGRLIRSARATTWPSAEDGH